MSKMVYHTINTMEKRNSIRIGFVGCVSCGKSTLLNAICVNQYEEMKKRRTTMLPSVYQETNNRIYSNEESKEILNSLEALLQNILSISDLSNCAISAACFIDRSCSYRHNIGLLFVCLKDKSILSRSIDCQDLPKAP